MHNGKCKNRNFMVLDNKNKMTEHQEDKIHSQIINEFKGCAMIGNIIHEKDWSDLADDLIKLLVLNNVSNQRELLVKFLNDIHYKELEKCYWYDNIPKVVDDYLTNCG
tara:strand:- start:41 stop:364 length:324 start_codon:yes stop_codon:yes gene_type:complete